LSTTAAGNLYENFGAFTNFSVFNINSFAQGLGGALQGHGGPAEGFGAASQSGFDLYVFAVPGELDHGFITEPDRLVLIGSAVPEPSTLAMMLLGLCGIAFMAYRRKSKPASMAA
jgi:hypothetical protein